MRRKRRGGKARKVTSQSLDEGGVVTVDPFASEENRWLAEPPEIKREYEERVSCLWSLGLRGNCPKIFDSSEELLNHLLKKHAAFSQKGYACRWSGCPKSKGIHYDSKIDFENHLKSHATKSGKEDKASSSQENDDKELDEGSGVESSPNDSDKDYSGRKRKKSSISPQSSKPKLKIPRLSESPTPKETIQLTSNVPVPVQKTLQSDRSTPDAVVQKAINIPETSNKINHPTVSFSFFRFTCMWEVSFYLKTLRNDKALQNVCCLRKFTSLDQSIDHLHNHHLLRVENDNELPKCHWKDCSMKDRVFDSLDELKKHVLVHTEEKVISFGSTVQIAKKRDAYARVSPIIRCSNPSVSVQRLQDSSSTTNTPARNSTNKNNQSDSGSEASSSSAISSTSNSWMIAAIRFLLSVQIGEFPADPCPLTRYCLFCKYHQLRVKLSGKNSLMPYNMSDITKYSAKFQSCDNDPIKFIIKFLNDMSDHKKTFHIGESIVDKVCVKEISGVVERCSRHQINNILDLFDQDYEHCSRCIDKTDSWPFISQDSIVIHTEQKLCHPYSMIAKGRSYKLQAVICRDLPTYYTYARKENFWVVYYDNSSVVSTKHNVSNDENAIIVLYVSEHPSELSSIDNSSETLSNENPSPAYDVTSEEVGNSVVPDPDPNIENQDTESLQRRDPNIERLFISRRLLNSGNESCIVSVIQALLTTSLSTVVKHLCSSSQRCYFCSMMSLSQRAICSKGGAVVDPFELTLKKRELRIYDEEGDPCYYIKDLIHEIASDEDRWHKSCDINKQFMIKFDEKSCRSCQQDYEVYHWPVSPSKKNESLFDLMTNCYVECSHCSDVAVLEAVSMPEHLIVTVDRKCGNDDVSVHYPDEWAIYDARYFLAAVVIRDPSHDTRPPHYFTYSKVFGKWMRYDDAEFLKASSCDALGSKHACVFVYVKSELTLDMVQIALDKAKDFGKAFERIPSAPVQVKTEVLENESFP